MAVVGLERVALCSRLNHIGTLGNVGITPDEVPTSPCQPSLFGMRRPRSDELCVSPFSLGRRSERSRPTPQPLHKSNLAANHEGEQKGTKPPPVCTAVRDAVTRPTPAGNQNATPLSRSTATLPRNPATAASPVPSLPVPALCDAIGPGGTSPRKARTDSAPRPPGHVPPPQTIAAGRPCCGAPFPHSPLAAA